MYDNIEVCEKIKAIYPDIGECGIDIEVGYEEEQDSLVVYMHKDNQTIKHYLTNEDADACLNKRQCVALGVEIGQFR